MNFLKSLIHNALQTLKKDDGAHFSYNLGVSFVRLGAVLLCAAVLLALAFIINPTDLLSSKGKTQASVTRLHVERYERRGSGQIINIYYVQFDCTIGDTHAVVEQTVPSLVYSKYGKIGMNNVFPARLYYSDKSGLYITKHLAPLAQLEYGRTHELAFAGMIAVWCAMGATGLIGFGLNQERLGMKYPRTDVSLNDTSLTLPDEDVDELLKEFDEAYDKFMANKAAGLPTSEPPRTDRGKPDEERLRLEKKND
ncbi:MAG: hypothetical protein K6B74_13385 [Ruminococcus sp.]|nr:hypothetical protein [Ruminococcus sp.]